MKKRVIALAFIAWAIVEIPSPSPARALAAIPGLQDVTEVVVTPAVVPAFTELQCGYVFYYLQLMTVHGFGKVWVPVDAVYSPDPKKEAFLREICEEEGSIYYIYELGDCQC